MGRWRTRTGTWGQMGLGGQGGRGVGSEGTRAWGRAGVLVERFPRALQQLRSHKSPQDRSTKIHRRGGFGKPEKRMVGTSHNRIVSASTSPRGKAISDRDDGNCRPRTTSSMRIPFGKFRYNGTISDGRDVALQKFPFHPPCFSEKKKLRTNQNDGTLPSNPARARGPQLLTRRKARATPKNP